MWPTDYSMQYIRQEMPRIFGLKTSGREKFEALEIDLDNLTRVLRHTNELHYRHERTRVQISLYLLLHAYTGARPGTFLEGKNKLDSGRCLTYRVNNTENCKYMTKTFIYTYITKRMRPRGGCLRLLNGISKEILMSMKIRPSRLPSASFKPLMFADCA